jgi:hypothetical protein
MVAADLVRHFEDRVAAMDGKAMVVCTSRRICVALYNQIVALRPEWHSDDDAGGTIKVVMTGSAADPQGWQPHIGTKARVLGLGERYVAIAFDKLKWVDQPVTSTTASTTSAPATAPATTSAPDGTTRTTTGAATTTTTTTTSASTRWYPDHVVYNATKEELKAMPEFKY